MAIKFLDNLDLTGLQITKVRLQNSAGTPATNLGGGQIVYDSTAGTIKYYDGVTNDWIELDGQGSGGTVTSVNGGTSTFVTNTVTNSTSAAVLTSTLSATGTPGVGNFLRGDNTWAAIPASMSFNFFDGTNTFQVTQNNTVTLSSPLSTISINTAVADTIKLDLTASGVTAASYTSANITVDAFGRVTAASSSGGGSMTSFIFTGDSGSAQTVTDGQTVKVAGGTALSSVASSPDTVTVNHDAFGTAGTYAYPTSVITNATGHITSIVAGSQPGTMSGWGLSADTGSSQQVTDGETVTIKGSVGIDTVVANTNNLTINLDLAELPTAGAFVSANDKIVITDNGVNSLISSAAVPINDWGTADGNIAMGSNKFTGLAVGTAGTDSVNLSQVQALVAGVGVFQGAYNATTNSPALTGSSNIALTTGDYFVVSVDGTNAVLGTLEVGDLIFANNTIAANSSPAIANYTVVIQDANIAGAGSTDGGTEKGVAGFDSANFTVSANGWVQLGTSGVTAGVYGSASSVGKFTVDTEGLITLASNQTIDIAASQVQNFCAEVESCVGTAFMKTGTTDLGTSTVVTHNFDTRNVQVEVYTTATPFDTVYARVQRNSVDQITIFFASSQAAGKYSYTIMAIKP